jgi:choline dehydrogenase-like flavoprotein
MPSFGEEYDYYAMAGILVHDQPSGTVKLNWSNDAVVDYTMSNDDQSKMIDGLKEASRIFFRADAKAVITGHIRKTILYNVNDLRLIDKRGAGMGSVLVASAHPQGGNRMGENSANSVVNSYCQAHEIPNLFICDASIFPTALEVSPQMTVMALASIAADHINQKLI